MPAKKPFPVKKGTATTLAVPVTWKDGNGLWWAGNDHCVFLVHGIGGAPSQVSFIGNMLAEKGYSVLAPQAGWDGKGLAAAAQKNEVGAAYKKSVDDLKISFDLLENQGCAKTTYIGTSLGAFAGFPFVASEPRVDDFISLQGGADLAALATKSGFDAKGVADLNPVNFAGKIKQPMLIVNGKTDTIVEPAQGQALQAAFPEAQTMWLEGGHMPTQADIEAVQPVVAQFLQAHG